ncbi:MAG: hypothetical protein ACI4RN_06065 [Oscillospiraceae bacterium]
MHALIRQGNGDYYVSYVFGYYRNITATDDYERYIESIHNPYWIVWNENKTKLIKLLEMEPDTKYIIPQLLIIDADQGNWILNDDGEGCVDFLNKDIIDSIVYNDSKHNDIIEKCKNIDIGYTYEEYQEIKTQADIDNLYWATGQFHDACITEEVKQKDGTLYLKFEGTWGCEVEVWFWGDLEYDTSILRDKYSDPLWYSSTVLLEDGFVYLTNIENMTVDLIDQDSHCYFKARHMKYHIIPD